MGVLACAELLRVSERTIRGWESGATRIPYAAYKLLRMLKGGRYLAHPIWRDFVVQGDTLITPEGHRFQAGELGWWSLLVRQARAFRAVLQERAARVESGLPDRHEGAAVEALALGLVPFETSQEGPALGSLKQGLSGPLLAAPDHRPARSRLARVVRAAGGAA